MRCIEYFQPSAVTIVYRTRRRAFALEPGRSLATSPDFDSTSQLCVTMMPHLERGDPLVALYGNYSVGPWELPHRQSEQKKSAKGVFARTARCPPDITGRDDLVPRAGFVGVPGSSALMGGNGPPCPAEKALGRRDLLRASGQNLSERGTVPFCSQDSAKSGQSPTVLSAGS